MFCFLYCFVFFIGKAILSPTGTDTGDSSASYSKVKPSYTRYKPSNSGVKPSYTRSKPSNSGWDGGVRQVKTWLNDNLKDPGSTEYIEWSDVMKWENQDGYAVRCKFRSKNGFGGYVIDDWMFFMRYDGNNKWWYVSLVQDNNDETIYKHVTEDILHNMWEEEASKKALQKVKAKETSTRIIQ
ncbi:MAG: hypothetical protein ACOCWG_04265 [bacterium]